VKLSWPAKSRISENSIIEKAQNATEHDEHRWVLKHLPKVLHAEDRHVNLLSRALIDRMGNQYEERVLRIMVQEELYPITERTAAADLAQSFRKTFKCRHSHSVPCCDGS
jgi:RAB protein geranylgeranyltransferase component A